MRFARLDDTMRERCCERVTNGPWRVVFIVETMLRGLSADLCSS